MSEIEIKLRGSPAALKAAIGRLARKAVKGSSFSKTLRAVYFDTAKDDLNAKGLSFRVREEDGRFVQTLKQTARGGGILRRGEWSDEVAGAAPDLLTTKSGRKLREVWKDIRLLPRFRTEIVRHGAILRPQRGSEIEVVRDEGEIHAIGRDEQVLRVSEIELELKRGAPGEILRLALRILAITNVQIEPRTKSGRGYALLSPDVPRMAVKAEAPQIGRRDSLAEVLRAAARCHCGQFLANQTGALAHDPGSIHQMRVAMRRLRATLYTVRSLLPEAEYESIRLKLKYLLQSLGPARDWEVLSDRISELEDEEELEAGGRQIKSVVKDHKRRALVSAVDTLGSRKNTKAMLEVMLWFEDLPSSRHGRKLKAMAGDAVPRLLDKLFITVRRRARHFPVQTVAERHRLRIACKNLRYNIDLYGPLFGARKAEKFLGWLKPVQDDLGHLNDVSRARDLLGALTQRSPRGAAAETVVARLEKRVSDAEKRARKHVAALRNSTPFW